MSKKNSKKNYVIGVSGGSGIGKTVLSSALRRYLGETQTLVISTDDLHRWERGSDSWKSITHLNPAANDLELGSKHLKKLKSGKSIERRIYNHESGKHNEPTKISSRRFIIHEGLHAFYGEKLSGLCDLKIFIETSSSLKRHWKILRDTQKRGYTKSQVLESISRRAFDHEKYLGIQKKDADIVIFLSEKNDIHEEGSPTEVVEVVTKIFSSTSLRNDRMAAGVVNFLMNDLRDLSEFVSVSKLVGADRVLISDSGGNTSLKTCNDKIMIKASGSSLKEMSYEKGFVIPQLSDLKKRISLLESISGRAEGDTFLYNELKVGTDRASMEAGFHLEINSAAVVHTHPVHLLTILCTDNSKTLLSEIYSEKFDFDYIEFATPGFSLTKSVMDRKDRSDILFLENHGLIVAASSMSTAHSVTCEIEEVAREYLKDNIATFSSYEEFAAVNDPGVFSNSNKGYLFPDDVIFSESIAHKETRLVASYVEKYGKMISQLRYLEEDDVNYIKNMKFEIDRRNK